MLESALKLYRTSATLTKQTSNAWQPIFFRTLHSQNHIRSQLGLRFRPCLAYMMWVVPPSSCFDAGPVGDRGATCNVSASRVRRATSGNPYHIGSGRVCLWDTVLDLPGGFGASHGAAAWRPLPAPHDARRPRLSHISSPALSMYPTVNFSISNLSASLDCWKQTKLHADEVSGCWGGRAELGFFDRVRTGELMNRLSEVLSMSVP